MHTPKQVKSLAQQLHKRFGAKKKTNRPFGPAVTYKQGFPSDMLRWTIAWWQSPYHVTVNFDEQHNSFGVSLRINYSASVAIWARPDKGEVRYTAFIGDSFAMTLGGLELCARVHLYLMKYYAREHELVARYGKDPVDFLVKALRKRYLREWTKRGKEVKQATFRRDSLEIEELELEWKMECERAFVSDAEVVGDFEVEPEAPAGKAK